MLKRAAWPADSIRERDYTVPGRPVMEGMKTVGKPNAEPASEAGAGATAPARTTGRVIDIDDGLIGRRFHHFEVRARLGHAATGTVYLADDTSLNQPVMLTMLRKPVASAETIVGDPL